MTSERLISEQDIRLQALTAETLGVDPDELDDHASPETLAAWTSFNHLMLMAAVEEAFGITLSMEDMSGVHNYGELRALVARTA